MSEDKLIADAARAARAREVLDHPLFAEAVETVKRSLVEAWAATAARDTEARERLHTAHTLVDRVREALAAAVANGQVAEAQIAAIRGKNPSALRRWAGV